MGKNSNRAIETKTVFRPNMLTCVVKLGNLIRAIYWNGLVLEALSSGH